jgi:Ser/Thr protein kinase RdoA (MazF antagonist)
MTGTLRAVLSRYPALARPTSEPSTLGNAGGFSGAGLWKFASGRGILGLKVWPVDGPDRAGLSRIHDWLSRASDLGFVPEPIRTLDGSSMVEADGRIWELTPWMPGVADLGRPPDPGRVRAMFTGLGAFHARLASTRSEGPSPGLAARLAELDRLLLGEFEALGRAIARVPGDPRSSMARDWIDRARALAPRLLGPLRGAASRVVPLQPCLRDARPDHFLFEGDRLTGLVDFGAMGRETVAGDLARLMTEAIGPDRAARALALAAYEGIRPLERREFALIDDFERANALLGPARWARWHFLDRRTFDDPEAVSRGLRRGLERLDEITGSRVDGGDYRSKISDFKNGSGWIAGWWWEKR